LLDSLLQEIYTGGTYILILNIKGIARYG